MIRYFYPSIFYLTLLCYVYNLQPCCTTIAMWCCCAIANLLVQWTWFLLPKQPTFFFRCRKFVSLSVDDIRPKMNRPVLHLFCKVYRSLSILCACLSLCFTAYFCVVWAVLLSIFFFEFVVSLLFHATAGQTIIFYSWHA